MKIRQYVFFTGLVLNWPGATAFQASSRRERLSKNQKASRNNPSFLRFPYRQGGSFSSLKSGNAEEIDLELLKAELTTYLEKRKEAGADAAAQE
jgi:hypothetical protein